MRILFSLFLSAVYADKSKMEHLITQAAANWTIIRPGRLTNGEARGKYRVLPALERGMRIGAISRKDVADFMVREAELPCYPGSYPALSY